MCNINVEIDFPGAKVVKTEKDQRGNLWFCRKHCTFSVFCRPSP